MHSPPLFPTPYVCHCVALGQCVSRGRWEQHRRLWGCMEQGVGEGPEPPLTHSLGEPGDGKGDRKEPNVMR